MEYTYFIVTTLICFGVCEDCVIKKLPDAYLEKKLVDQILKEYPFDKPCTNNTDHVEVELGYIIQAFFFDSNEEKLTLLTWNVYEWTDENLKWDIDKYKGMKSAHINNFDIWFPSMKLLNNAEPDDWDMELTDDCKLKHTGHVKCAPTMERSVMCSSTLKNWPYDTKNCTLKFNAKSWFDIEESKIIFSKIDVFLGHSTNSAGWTIVNTIIKTRNLTGEHQATIELTLERKAECLEASIVIPAFVVSLLSVTSIFLNIKDNVRLGILCFSLLSHFVFCNEISENIPRHGADTPVILYFVSHSTMLTLFLFILTFILQLWSKLKTSPLRIIVFLNSLVFKTHGKHFVFPRWNVEVLDKTGLDSLSDSTEWLNFCNIINSVGLFLSVITYIILFSLYMPHFTPDTH